MAAQARLPDGWTLDALRCTSTGADPDTRSANWTAVALGPDSEERSHQADGALDAIEGLAAAFEG